MKQVKSRIWIEQEGEAFLGFGRVTLLKKVAETRSISAAAKAIGMSYKKAWNLINTMNTSSSQPLVITNTGGKDGGGTFITDYGHKMITEFETLNNACEAFLNEKFNTIIELDN
ncbi:winged helix-turn-helix domain-containing protein [Leeuwenhoekiella marinoflava]|uniref:Molybdate transport system regulatory protein n=2 Tax=Leeuwenhoekiella marinoflava TaxID=988 RepID=A0A4Q0PQT2_9FLAO|nr:winged helix-turn-helix domain-containing protein [Leeuwenhoekiella marinoflava]RXG32225.1 molybdate transport system regulatory protein [Leeuwenhoekiella marinoflava]SHE82767.1 molybdate transport system regulatory protein [Leeuwenhoekiella marinoflava DSM 3653]